MTKRSNEFSPAVHDFIDQLECWQESLSTTLEHALQLHRAEKGFVASCRQCTNPGCCRQKVFAHYWEGLVVARWILEHGLDNEEFRRRLQLEGKLMEGSPSADWLNSERDCVFLEEGRCSIYEIRPWRCRAHYSFTPPEKCLPPSGQTVALLDHTPMSDQVMRQSLAIHRDLGLKETKKRILLGTLPRVVFLALESVGKDFQEFIRRQPWPSDTTLERWLNGENLLQCK